MNRKADVFAPGARIVVRDAEWLVRKVDRTSTGGQADEESDLGLLVVTSVPLTRFERQRSPTSCSK